MPNPNIPYPISGYVYDIDGSTAAEGAVVTALNGTTGEELATPYQSTTNASGEYSIDLANLTSGYSNGDKIVVKVTYSGTDKIKEYATTVVVATGYEEKNLTLTYYDVLGMINELLSTYWERARTDNITPSINKIFDKKRVDLTSGQTAILTYERDTINEKNSLGSLTKRMICPITVQVLTKKQTGGREQAIKARNEIDRIINTYIINPANGWDILDSDNNWIDLSDKSNFLWKYSMDMQFEKLNMSRTGEWYS